MIIWYFSYKGCRAPASLAKHPPAHYYLSRDMVKPLPYHNTIVSRLPIRNCLARLWGTLQYNTQIDDNLVFPLQRLPSTREPCNYPQEQLCSCIARQGSPDHWLPLHNLPTRGKDLSLFVMLEFKETICYWP